MPVSTYHLFARAVQNRVRLACLYDGYAREICPIILGSTDGVEKALVWQISGETSKGPLRRPKWKCFFLSKVTDVAPVGGTWETADRHQQAQSCVKIVDYDANEQSPYCPRHSLGELRGKRLDLS